MTSLGFQGLVYAEKGATVQPPDSGVHDQSNVSQDYHQNGSSDTERGAHDMEHVNTSWKEIQDMRGLVTRNRLELRERRVELKQDRAHARELEAQIWRYFQSFWHGNAGLDISTIDPLFFELNKARDELGPKEETYNELEDELDALEYRLEMKESRFYTRFEKIYRDDKLEPSFTDSSDRSHRAWFRSSASDHTDNSSSPLNRYLSKIGDATIIRERLSELEAEQRHYLEVERERDALGYPLYQPNVEFLNTFPDIRAQYLEELRQIEEDLRALGHEPGVPRHATDDETSSSASRGILSKPASLQDVSPSSASIPVLRPPRRRSDGDLSHDTQDVSPRARINQWILDVLTNSPLERARHRAILDNPELNDSAWLRLVREYWEKDHGASSLHKTSRGDESPCSAFGTAHLEINLGADTNTSYSNLSQNVGLPATKAKIENENPEHTSERVMNSVDELFDVPVNPKTVDSSLVIQASLDEMV